MHKIIKILIATSILCNIGFALYEPIYAIFVQQIGGDILAAAASMGLFAIVLGVFTIIFGKLTDANKCLKNKFIVLGYAIVTAAFAGYYFVKHPIDLFVIQAVIGFGTAMIDPGWSALFGMHVKKNNEATEWGLWEGAKQIAIGIFAITGGAIASVFGFKTLIVIMFTFEVLATISVARLLWTKCKA